MCHPCLFNVPVLFLALHQDKDSNDKDTKNGVNTWDILVLGVAILVST